MRDGTRTGSDVCKTGNVREDILSILNRDNTTVMTEACSVADRVARMQTVLSLIPDRCSSSLVYRTLERSLREKPRRRLKKPWRHKALELPDANIRPAGSIAG